MRKPILAAATAALVALSCSHDDSTRDARPMTRAEFCQNYSERECADVVPACLVTEADCLAAQKAWCTAWGQGEEDALPPRPFDPQNANACLAKVSAVFDVLKNNLAIQASDYGSIADACARVFHGDAKANETCAVDADCSGTLICNKDHCGTLSQVAPNAGCANIGEDCPQGYYCGGETGVLICTARPGSGGMCSVGVPCLEDLRCVGGICTDRLDIGFACQGDGDCVSGFCEPFVLKCATAVRFAPETPACQAYQPVSVPASI